MIGKGKYIVLIITLLMTIGIYKMSVDVFPIKMEACEYILEEVEYEVNTEQALECKELMISPYYAYWLVYLIVEILVIIFGLVIAWIMWQDEK